ncbi:phosphodiester glycosidase family protein [Hoyosella rhizosphaerae]|uniref:Phosphodiester glycosidase domain-containing protein n=1 Tax=Hoyosella rhizosphaerae TaxID=1755582 RepID=A0A916XB81_9ACTN|nr:phosphodiester glycosidase family protein [Hoyosella rhizosphaerae]MBN4926230.1 phosphodiester glycosidase family protein [Hoyosella rhizosphaerae]GGC61054.1 hypothetical protein GCM10011410_11910 [Hoyosella rhizosphaerae]
MSAWLRLMTVTVAAAMSVVVAPLAAADNSGSGSTEARQAYSDAIDTSAGRVVAYQTGANFPMAMQRQDRSWYSTPRDARIVVVPNARRTITGRLLLDAQGGSDRCANTPGTQTSDGTQLRSALFSADEAWRALDNPAVLINTNFFDVRPQLSGRSWRETLCSAPFGVYFDNSSTASAGESVEAAERAFYSGPKGLTGELEQGWGRLATFVISGDGTGDSSVEMLVAPSPFDNDAAEARLRELQDSGRIFTAFSGLSILHPSGAVDIPDGVRTARSAIGYSPAFDRLFVVQAGSALDPSSGLTQEELGDLFRGLGATMAVQLDSGGSSALVINRHSGVFWAGEGVNDGAAPAGACPELHDAVCSPGMTASGQSRQVPSWLGIGTPVFADGEPGDGEPGDGEPVYGEIGDGEIGDGEHTEMPDELPEYLD